MVARSIIETVQSIQNRQECLSLLEIITKLSDDTGKCFKIEQSGTKVIFSYISLQFYQKF